MTKIMKEFTILLSDEEFKQVEAGKGVSAKICKTIKVTVKRGKEE